MLIRKKSYRCKNQWWCVAHSGVPFTHPSVYVLNKLMVEHIFCTSGFPPPFIVAPYL